MLNNKIKKKSIKKNKKKTKSTQVNLLINKSLTPFEKHPSLRPFTLFQ